MIINKIYVRQMRDYFVKRVAVDTEMDERIVNTVVSHQFEKARDAMVSFFSIEISGFGRFYFNVKKAKKKLEQCKQARKEMEEIINSEDTSDKDRKRVQFELGKVIGDIILLERKLKDED